jgi:hypothetical protein
LRAKGVDVLGEADEGYGKCAWLADPDRALGTGGRSATLTQEGAVAGGGAR